MPPVSAISSVVANVQLASIQTMLQFMQVLQFATLGAAVAGIGVSVTGFALMNKKLNAMSDQVIGLRSDVRRGFDEIERARLRDMLSALLGVIALAEHKYAVGCDDKGWKTIGEQLIHMSERFHAELVYLINKDHVEFE